MEQLPAPQAPGDDTRHLAPVYNRARQIQPVPPPGYVEIESQESGSDDWNRWLEYWHALSRNKVPIAAVACLGVLAAFVASLFQTPVYMAGTTLEFQAQGSQQQPFEGISYLNTFDPFLLQTQAQLLRSGALQGRVYAKLLDKATAGAGAIASPVSTGDPGLVGRVRNWFGLPSHEPGWEEGITDAMAGLTVTPVKESRIVQISSQSTSAAAAADYVNTLANEFIQQNLEDRWALYQSTGTWLARAQEDLKADLERAEKNLLAYASASGLVVTSKNENIAEQKLIQLQTEVSKAQADRIAKESVYRTAKSQTAESLADVLDAGPMAQYQTKLADLRRELADATTLLTAAHPRVKRLEAQIQELESAKVRESANILSRMRTEYESAQHRENQLVADFHRQSQALSEQDQKLIRYNMLQREADTYRELYETTLLSAKAASVASALRPVSARIIDSARPARTPMKPNLPRNLTLGLLGGLVAGIGLVLVRERTDASIRVPGTLPTYLNLRELGVIPSATIDPDLPALSGRTLAKALPVGSSLGSISERVRLRPAAEPVELATWNRKSSLVAESFRGAVTSILSAEQNGRERQVILVTSPSPREGKSTVATNLAIALAEIDQRVLLIDADLRRPRLHSIFNHANTWGLSDLLREKTPCAEYPPEALSKKTHVPRLHLLPSGPGSVNVSRLLYSSRMSELVARFRGEFDAVLIDSPPLMRVADARIVSRLADAVVLVFRAGQTTREAAAMAVSIFDADGIPVLGTVLNDWNPRTMGHGYYPSDYRSYYSNASNL